MSNLSTIDVDDTLTESDLGNIRVSDSEISGALIRVSGVNLQSAEAEFGIDSQATVAFACKEAKANLLHLGGYLEASPSRP